MKDQPQLLVVDRGALRVETPTSRAIVPVGHAAYVPSGARYRPEAVGTVAVYSLILPRGEVERLAPKAPQALRVFQAPQLLREMVRESSRWSKKKPGEEIARSLVVLTCGLLDRWMKEPAPTVLPMGESPELRRALNHLMKRLEHPVGLADAARAAEVSERTLQRRCRAELGLALSAWLTRARILTAVEMLTDQDLAVADVALRSGYQSAAAFTRAFSQLLGATPSTWRVRA